MTDNFKFRQTKVFFFLILQLTDQIIGGDDDTTDKQKRTCNSVVAPKDHVINDRFINEIANFDKSRNSGHHSKDGHIDELI